MADLQQAVPDPDEFADERTTQAKGSKPPSEPKKSNEMRKADVTDGESP